MKLIIIFLIATFFARGKGIQCYVCGSLHFLQSDCEGPSIPDTYLQDCPVSNQCVAEFNEVGASYLKVGHVKRSCGPAKGILGCYSSVFGIGKSCKFVCNTDKCIASSTSSATQVSFNYTMMMIVAFSFAGTIMHLL